MLAWSHPTCAHLKCPDRQGQLGLCFLQRILLVPWLDTNWDPRDLSWPAGANLWASWCQPVGRPWGPFPLPALSRVMSRVPVHSCLLSSASSHHTPGHTTYMYTHTHHGHLCSDRQAVCLSESGLPWVGRRKDSVAQTPLAPHCLCSGVGRQCWSSTEGASLSGANEDRGHRPQHGAVLCQARVRGQYVS